MIGGVLLRCLIISSILQNVGELDVDGYQLRFTKSTFVNGNNNFGCDIKDLTVNGVVIDDKTVSLSNSSH